MDMQAMMLFGGVIMLVIAVTAKALLSRLPFHRVAVGFTILWASFFACHFWAPCLELLQLVVRTDSDEVRMLGSFWLAFVLGTLPGAFMIHAWMRNWDPDFPKWFEQTAGGLAAALAGLLLMAHLVMSAEIASPLVRAYLAGGDLPTRAVKYISRYTLRTYARVGGRVCRMNNLDLAQQRIPIVVLETLRERPAQPPRRPQPYER